MATKKETAQEKRERIAAQKVQMQSLQSQIDQILGGQINQHIVKSAGAAQTVAHKDAIEKLHSVSALKRAIPSVLEKLKDAIEYHNRSIDPNWS